MIWMPIQAFIFEVHSIKKNNNTVGGPEWVIGLSDLHDKKHPGTQDQKKHILNFLTRLPKGQVKVLTEDLSSCGSFGRKQCGNFYINSRGGILGGFTQECQMRGIDVDNHEFRYCRVSSLGPVINNACSDAVTYPSTSRINIATLYNEVKEELDHIRQFDDGTLLKKMYQSTLHKTEQFLNNSSITDCNTESVASYLKKYSCPLKYTDLVCRLLTFDSELLDCKLIHAIKQEKRKKYIVVIAGGAHVKRVCDLLVQDGYTRHTVYSVDQSSPKAVDLSRLFAMVL